MDAKTGKATIEQLAPGFYDVVLPGATEWRLDEGWQLEPGSEGTRGIILGSRTMRGRVAPAEEFRVAACTLVGDEMTARTRVGDDGEFELTRVGTGRFLFDVELDGLPHRLWRGVDVLVPASGNDAVQLNLPFAALGILEIDVATVDGRPLVGGGFEVECRPVNDDANVGKLAPLGAGSRSVVYGALAPAGRHDVRVRVSGRTVWRGRVEVKAGARVRETARVE